MICVVTGGSARLKGSSLAETRSAVLDLIRSAGEISRADIARRSALTEKTISGIVRSLLDSGVIIESGYAASTGGKRPVLLRLNDKELYAVGLTLDVARCLLVVCAVDGTEVARSDLRGTGDDQPPVVLARVAAALRRLLHRQGIDHGAVVGLGVAMGGRRGVARGWREETTLADRWEPYDTAAELSRLTGLPVIRENDADAAALGEYWTAGSAAQDFVTVYLAYGIGCGIVINGSLYRGASGNAGEIGHTLADPAGPPCWCGRRGCLDTVASPRALTEHIRGSAELSDACAVTAEMPFEEVHRRFVAATIHDHPLVRDLVATTADHLAGAVVNLVNTLDLSLVSLAGPGFAGLGDHYRRVLEERLNQVAFLRDVHPITVRLGITGTDAAALGAASVVLHRRLTPHHASLG